MPRCLQVLALLLQAHDRASDQGAVERANLDARRCAPLRIVLDPQSFAKSTLRLFRAQVHLHERLQAIFLASTAAGQVTPYRSLTSAGASPGARRRQWARGR